MSEIELLYDERGRRILSLTEFALYSIIPISILFIMASTPVHILSTKVKQLISLPLLVTVVVIPYKYKDPINGTCTTEKKIPKTILTFFFSIRIVFSLLSGCSICYIFTFSRRILDYTHFIQKRIIC